jgi:dTDP-4-dehydrorhamnose reductase
VAPDVVINAIGLVKQRPDAVDPIKAVRVNALLPHLLHRAVSGIGGRLIQISTDCVFDGARGGYRESETPDAVDLYGRSKVLGEVTGPGALTLRTSMVGRELSGRAGLLEWFLSHRNGEVPGFTHAVFSGLTTPVFSDLLLTLVERHPGLTGLYHVGADPIDKARLLRLLNDAYGAGVAVVPAPDVRLDRSLDSSAFRAATGWVPPSWESMVSGLAASPLPYDDWRA